MAPKRGYRAHLTEERFWSKVDRRGPDECWLWTAGTDSWGYGRFQFTSGRLRTTHRISYEFANGTIPPGLVIRHTCDNPPCVNPAHLVSGSFADNSRDMVKRGRTGNRVGEANGHARLTAAEVQAIRESDEPRAVLAERYGVKVVTIYSIRGRRLWAHLP